MSSCSMSLIAHSSNAPINDSSTAAPPETTRLYISPLESATYSTLLGPSLVSEIKHSSFHTLATFPDKPYGFITLPTASALALKKKLNGSHLRGHKMRVEEARIDKKRKHADEEREDAERSGGGKKSKRQKKERTRLEEGVLPAVEIEEGRSVKRGWTGEKSKSKSKSSSNPSKKEKRRDSKTSKEEKPDRGAAIIRIRGSDAAAKDAVDRDGEKKKKKKKKRDEIVEFENTTKFPTFLRGEKIPESSKATEFVDDKGWVDADGNVVESISVRRSARKKTKAETSDDGKREKKPSNSRLKSKNEPVVDSANATTEDVEMSNDSRSTSSNSPPPPSSSQAASTNLELENSHEIGEYITRSETPKSTILPTTEPMTPSQECVNPVRFPKSTLRKGTTASVSPGNDGISDRPATSVDTKSQSEEKEKPIHPLEALFKRPSKPPATSAPTSAPSIHGSKPNQKQSGSNQKIKPRPIKTSFSFDFKSDDRDEEEEDENDTTAIPNSSYTHPQTPFTRHDSDERGVRSAAPTPDTAAIGKRFSWRSVSVTGGRRGSSDVGLRRDSVESDLDMTADVDVPVPPLPVESELEPEHEHSIPRPAVTDKDVRTSQANENENDGNDSNDNDSDSDDEGDEGDDAMDTTPDLDLNPNQNSNRNTNRNTNPENTKDTKDTKEKEKEQKEEQNDFEKHFYDQRGEYTKAWKLRKREARKEVRQVENRRVGFGK